MTSMNPRLFLMNALKEAKVRNSLFSLRAMARQLSISPGHLSQLVSGKRPLTLRVALEMANRFDMTPDERKQLFRLAQDKKSSQKSKDSQTQFHYLETVEFDLISDWYYYAILSLGDLKSNKASARWISKTLRIGFPEAKEAFEKLKIMGFIEVKNGKFRQTTKPLHSTRDIPSVQLRKYHRQNLDLAIDCLETVPVEKRDNSSMTMALDIKKIPQAKKMIHDFKVKLSRFLESGETNEVYTLSVQLFPLTNETSNKEGRT